MMHRVFASPSRRRAFTLGLLALLSLAWSSLAAAANCTSSSATMTLPDVTITSSSMPIGTVLATSAPVTISFTCSGLPVTTSRPADYIATIQAGQSLATLDATNNVNGPGITFKISGVNGVALLVTASPTQASSRSGDVADGPNKYAGFPVGSVTAPAGTSQGSYSSTFTETFIGQLVVTGNNVTTGTISGGNLIPFWWYVSGGSQYSSSIALGTYLVLGSSKIKSSSCSVNLDSQNLTVTLPNVTTADLNGSSLTAGKTPFSINLTCKSSSKDIVIAMTASNPATATGVILPSGTGYAGNVGVQILNGAGTAVNVKGGTQTIATSTPNGAYSIPFFAQYYRTGSPATAGQVNATVTFVMTYP